MNGLCFPSFMHGGCRRFDIGDQMDLIGFTALAQMYQISDPSGSVSAAKSGLKIIGGLDSFRSWWQLFIVFEAYLARRCSFSTALEAF